jgi:hypothetical protein
MTDKTGFKILIASPPEYQKLVAEIHYDGKFVALVNQERGPGLFEVETPGVGLNESMIIRRVDLAGFAAALKQASDSLIEE